MMTINHLFSRAVSIFYKMFVSIGFLLALAGGFAGGAGYWLSKGDFILFAFVFMHAAMMFLAMGSEDWGLGRKALAMLVNLCLFALGVFYTYLAFGLKIS